MARSKVFFDGNVGLFDVPEGKRVSGISVVEVKGRESISVVLEDVPEPRYNILGTLRVERGGEA